ncbi:hypothetical protein [Spirosoma montaniterrae]|uniref:Uncharacterized protein n=1 Tax=Spirosoma montaniterrae TaxID=1178516 RepID=A0A1P9WW49_9BACT|nr:hypothetical protein [Spirosoma montaniterrae]AQG79606.1 hypothetical protein AWR27_09880 [Spirosoma montaniterrae]
MKTTLFAFAFSSLLFLGCSGGSLKEAGTHTHDDGSVHADHVKGDTTKQEEFTVGSDTTAAKPHTHKDGEKHDHAHGDDHKHE